MSLNDYDKRLCASEIFSSGVCNLNCTYCYIPKNKEMDEYHKKILEKLNDGTFIQNLKEVYGDSLSHLGFWGTEQTLIFHKLALDIRKYINEFPNLRQIGFSTNMYAFPERIIGFFDAIEAALYNSDRTMTVQWQVSIDGPPWINDQGRGEGSTLRVVKNTYRFFELLAAREYKKVSIVFSFKPTVDIPYIEKMNENFQLLVDYYKFFDEICGYIIETTKEYKGIGLYLPNNAAPTIVVPGKYTSSDGKSLARFFKNISKIEQMSDKDPSILPHRKGYSLNPYVSRLFDLIHNWNEIQNNPTNGTCSGGDTQLGIDLEGGIHTCHRTFLFNNDDYIKTLYSNDDYDEWSVGKLEKGIMKNVRKYVITNKDDSERNKLRSLYTYRSYHDGPYLKKSIIIHYLKMLAKTGQASRCYEESDELCHMFASFIDKAMSCPIENYLNNGSFHMYPLSIIRLWGNGAFEAIMKEYLNRRGDI